MKNIRELLKALTAKEKALRETRFLAPCARGGKVRLRVGGLLYSFTPLPESFEGWGIFEARDEARARLVEEASAFLTGEYLKLFKRIRLRLAYRLRGQTWLATPAGEADARQRFGTRQPQVVCLVSEGAQFEQIVARWDCIVCWFQEVDRRADPADAECLRRALRYDMPPAQLAWKGCTPEMRVCYEQARQHQQRVQRKRQPRDDESRLREALTFGGGELREFHDRGDYWQVEWAAHGENFAHTSAIGKRDLTVISAGICLSDRDRDFDLQSLVRVVGAQDDYWID